MSDGEALESNPAPCLNCGSTLQGKYCCSCGQKANVHRSLSAIGHDMAHGVLHIDGKIWNTLPLLLLKPGELTRRYIAGERAKFLSPMGLYLFSVFLLFAVMALVPSSGQAVKVQPQVATETQNGNPEDINLDTIKGDDVRDKITIGVGDDDFQKYARDKIAYAVDNKELLFYKIKANGYKLAWLLIPLSLPFMWLVLIGRRGFRVYDHAVFVTYSISFMGLLVSVAALLGAIPYMEWLELILLALIPPIHLYKHLKYSYGLGRIEAVARLILLFLSIQFVTMIYAVLLVILGIL